MKKALHSIKAIVTWFLMIASIGMMVFTVISVTTFDQPDRNLFGYKPLIVLSDSMSKTDFNAGDLVLIKETDPSTLKEGDIIAYTSTVTENYGETVTHKIRRVTADANGDPGFITYGTTTNTDDETVVTYEYVLGKYENHIPKIGSFFQFLKTTPGYICCIFIPFILLIVINLVDSIRLFRKYKAEQKAELQAERDEIAKERAESQKMMEELLKLQEQLEITSNGINSNHAAAYTQGYGEEWESSADAKKVTGGKSE